MLVVLCCCGVSPVHSVRGGEHPRLLITRDDIPRLRHAFGIQPRAADTRTLGRFGERAADLQALRAYFSRPLGEVVLPGEAAATALLHVVNPGDPADDRRLAAVRGVLTQPVMLLPDTFETVLALDWCWDALEPAIRREFLLQIRAGAEPLTPADSPLDHREFREKLTVLAVALAVDEADERSAWWAALRGQILQAAERYFTNTFPTFVRWRGLIPTSPAAAAYEENDTVLAIELAGLLAGTPVWHEYSDSVARWLEHYLLVHSTHPAFQTQFRRDDGTEAPPIPAPRWNSLLPLTAHLLANRTRDPGAAAVADQVESALMGSTDVPSATLWRWVPAVFDLRGAPRADLTALPVARNLHGAVVLRGGNDPGAALIWIDTGQPFLRRGQHFDAGQFLIRAGGDLAVEGGDDVEFEATRAKRGDQRLGRRPGPFDFAQYSTSTIAHNCMLFWDPVRAPRWYGRRYAPAGGQTPREGTCRDFVTPPESQSRMVAKLRAYGQRSDAAYVALDLAPAYDSRSVSRYTREFVFLGGSVLLVIDRATTANAHVVPTWVINVPTRPRVDSADLASGARVAGSDNQAGVWRCDHADWLRWNERDGSLWCKSLLPSPRTVAVVGGPGRRLVIPAGKHKGQTYLGGDAEGFERLIQPSGRPNPANAWYRLGEPTLLGSQFGRVSHWGRVEIEAAGERERFLFVHALVVDAAHATGPPDIGLSKAEPEVELRVSVGSVDARVVLPATEEIGGRLMSETPTASSWVFPGAIEDDGHLPVR